MRTDAQIHLYVSHELHRKLKAQAATDGLNIQDWTRKVLEAALKGLRHGEPSAIAASTARKGGRS